MKLLLHTCCAPCAIHTGREAKKDGFELTGFFYNPNIHPISEYERREKEAEAFFKSENWLLIIPGHDEQEFFKNISEKTSPLKRCEACWKLRLEISAHFAKENGFDAFTTTLLISPYQDHLAIKKICEDLSKKEKIKFYYKDFRKGFKESQDVAKEKSIYRQKYCGCVFSIIEREESRVR